MKWGMACVTSITFSILINSAPCKGLDKETLCLPFCLLWEWNIFLVARCKKLSLTRFMFADDLLIFARADTRSLQLIFDAFNKFSQAFGLEANLDKSILYLGGVSEDQRNMLQTVNMPLGIFPFKYLGVPLTTRKLFYHECKPLIDKTMEKVRAWFVKKLSNATKLVTSILHGFQLY